MPRSRVWVFTNFDLWENSRYESLIGKQGVRYIAYGLETCPTSGRPHHQGWLCFKTQKTSVKAVAKLLGCAHVEPMEGSLQSNNRYCSKESELVKFGDEPRQGDRNDLKAVVKRIRDGETTADEICLDDPAYYHMYGRTLQKAEDILNRKRFRTERTLGTWYYGKTGTGKSHLAFTGFNPDTHYVKCLKDEWWDRYTGQETVILNEFRGEIPFGEMLNLVDQWPHSVKRRNREEFPFLAKRIIVTSPMSPTEIYTKLNGDDRMEQLIRRFDIAEILPGDNPEIPGGKLIWRTKTAQKCSEGNTMDL